MGNSKPSKGHSKKGPSIISKTYLFTYNFVQILGWSYLLYLIINFYINKAGDSIPGELWPNVKLVVVVFQNAAFLEIIHAATGLVPSNVVITTFQVLSRLMVVNGVLLATPTGPHSPGLPLCLTAWAVTEIIRYLYYALNIADMVPYALVWCRYTFFIILYPLGVTGELLCFYWAQAYVSDHKIFTYELPNLLNFTFSYHYFLLLVMLLYIPLFPQMYLHMFAQRRKIIGGGRKKKGKKQKGTNPEPESEPRPEPRPEPLPNGSVVVVLSNEEDHSSTNKYCKLKGREGRGGRGYRVCFCKERGGEESEHGERRPTTKRVDLAVSHFQPAAS